VTTSDKPGGLTLYAFISTDPKFWVDRICDGGDPPIPGDDWLVLRLQDVFPRSGKDHYWDLGTLYTRVYQVTLPSDPHFCDLLKGRSGTLLAEGTSREIVSDLNVCTVNETYTRRGGGHLGTTPDFACESGTARFDYGFRYTLSNDAAVDADCNLTAGDFLLTKSDGPNLTCIGQ
jgi:hypothetical protein